MSRPACRDIGCDQDVVLALSEALRRSITLRLRHVALQSDCVVAEAIEFDTQPFGAVFSFG